MLDARLLSIMYSSMNIIDTSHVHLNNGFLLFLVQAYCAVFSSGDLPSPKAMLEVRMHTFDSHCNAILDFIRIDQTTNE
jgi:hypothetical protein